MRGMRIILLAALVLLVMDSRMSHGATWTSARRLTFTAGSSACPYVAVNGLNVYAVWYDNTSGGYEIYFKRSIDGGITWPASQRLTFSPRDAYVPAIAVSGTSLYVVWVEGSDAAYTDDVYFKKSTDGGATWQATQRLTYSTDSSYPDMDLALDVSGSNVYVVWYDDPTGSQEIYFRKSTNGGVTWQAAQRLTFVSGWSWKPVVVADGSSIHVVWAGDGILYKKSTNGGASWTAARWINALGAGPCLAVDSSGSLHVASYGWPGGGESEVYYQKSSNAGVTWTAARRLTWTAAATWLPDITFDSSGNIYLVWGDYTAGSGEIYFRRSPDAGATWQATQRLTFNGGNSNYPNIAANSSTVFVFWNDDTPGNCEIYFKRSIGGSI